MEVTGIALGVLALLSLARATMAPTLKNSCPLLGPAKPTRIEGASSIRRRKIPVCARANLGPHPDNNSVRHCGHVASAVRSTREFLAVKKKYDLEPPQVQQTIQLLLGDGDTSRIRLRLLLSRADTAAAFQLSSGWARRLRWAVWDKKSAQRMVEEFEEWNNRVRQLIETVWWPLSFRHQRSCSDWTGTRMPPPSAS